MDAGQVKALSRKVDIGSYRTINNFQDMLDFMDMCRKNDEYIYIEYEGKKLYAMLDDKNSICEKVMGVNYKTYKQARKRLFKEMEMEEAKAELEAIESMPTWIERGNKIIPKYKQKDWKKAVKQSIKGLYKGTDAYAALQMMEALEEGKDYEQCLDILRKGDHSGGSATCALYMAADFSDKGPDLFRYENKKHGALAISNLEEYLQGVEAQNALHKEQEIENE